MEQVVNPHITFLNCVDMSVGNLVRDAKISLYEKVNGAGWNETNNVRVTVDDEYDLYLFDYKTEGRLNYLNTIMGLKKCRQYIRYNNYGLTTLKNGKVIDNIRPYGYVESINITIPDYNVEGTITVTVYDNKGNKLGQTELKAGTSEYSIPINKFADEYQIKFTHNLSQSPDVQMNIEIVKY